MTVQPKVASDTSSRSLLMRASSVIAGLTLLISGLAQDPLRDPDIPDLTIVHSNGNVTVSWPVWPLNLHLTSSQSPTTGTNPALVPVSVYIDNEARVTIPATNTQQFFRLSSPAWFTPALQRLALFEYAIFSAVDLEITPSPLMRITGPVHCNSNLYVAPFTGLTFESRITSAGTIHHTQSPQDPGIRSNGPITYLAGHGSHTPSLGLILSNNISTAWRQILEVPSHGEDPASELGQQRLYHKADLIITVTTNGISATSGSFNNFAISLSAGQLSAFVTTNVTFYNPREGKTIRATEIDIGRLRQWNTTNTLLRPVLPVHDIRMIYISDQRTFPPSAIQTGIRLVNGKALLPNGFTVATPNPLYINGDYNAFSPGTTNSGTMPAAIFADAIHVLSTNWNDSASASPLGSRIAGDTTINAAFVGGNVPSDGTNYSGGIENFPRFLEDWSGRSFTFNGSMAILFSSVHATAPWGKSTVYNPPVRQWSYDWNFMDLSRMPPSTPMLKTIH